MIFKDILPQLKKHLTVKNALIVGLMIVLLVTNTLTKCSSDKKVAELREVILENDGLRKDDEGRYSKLVNDMNKEKDLNRMMAQDTSELSDQLKETKKEIKKSDEKVLSLTNIISSFKQDTTYIEVYPDVNDSTVFNFEDNYPATGTPFINYSGQLDIKTNGLSSVWTFGELPLKVILTETDFGIWRTRVVGPEWFQISDIEVNSLPAKEYSNNNAKWLKPFLGLRLSSDLTNPGAHLGIQGGMIIKSSWIVSGDINTSGVLGLSLLKTF